MENRIEKKNKRLPDWCDWSDVQALARITDYSIKTIYAMLIGTRNDENIKEAVEQYKTAKQHIRKAEERIINGLKAEFQAPASNV